jgi:hypothetical protein
MPGETVAVVDRIGRREFYDEFVEKRRPVLIRGLMQDWKALAWDGDRFRANERGVRLAVKTGDVSAGSRETVLLSEYVDRLERHQAELDRGLDPPTPPYLHDVPFFELFPEYRADIEPFPLHLFPKWYWPGWHRYIQFFMGATGSLTPLHFDTLCTHNLFFQLVGTKRWVLIPAEQREYCYMDGWRWARFDPSEPDFQRYPRASATTPMEVTVGPGDVLFIPSGTLHQVRSLSFSISFNIDWHTPRTARVGMLSVLRGAPWTNLYYNVLTYLGVGLHVPSRLIFPYYRSYLNYVS